MVHPAVQEPLLEQVGSAHGLEDQVARAHRKTRVITISRSPGVVTLRVLLLFNLQ